MALTAQLNQRDARAKCPNLASARAVKRRLRVKEAPVLLNACQYNIVPSNVYLLPSLSWR